LRGKEGDFAASDGIPSYACARIFAIAQVIVKNRIAARRERHSDDMICKKTVRLFRIFAFFLANIRLSCYNIRNARREK